jgi:hypothetical protein
MKYQEINILETETLLMLSRLIIWYNLCFCVIARGGRKK